MKPSQINLVILGLGSIGGSVLRALEKEPIGGLRVAGACDLAEPDAETMKALGRLGIPLLTDAGALLDLGPDYLLETAGVEAAAKWTLPFLRRGVSVITISSGGLVSGDLLREACRLCRPEGPRLIIPSGAVGGLDIVRAAAEGSVRRVHLRTVKPAGALVPNGDAPAAGEPRVIYRGSAAEAVERFPRNINVAMSLAIAGLGPEATTVEIIADPAATQNMHHVTVEGDFGTADITLRNLPSPANPRSSLLAVYSVLATLRRLTSGIVAGT